MLMFFLILLGAVLINFVLMPLYVRLKRRRFRNRKYNPALKLTIKGSATLVSVGFCLAGILKIYNETKDINDLTMPNGFHTDLMLLIGLSVCMIADVVLGAYFPVGVLFFLAGHICYIIYFIKLGGLMWWTVPLFLIGACVLWMNFRKYMDVIKSKKLWPALIVYGTVIMLTAATGITLPFALGEYGLLPALASILLVTSDIMLGINLTTKQKILHDLLYLGYYFSGQYIMALSVFVPAFILH